MSSVISELTKLLIFCSGIIALTSSMFEPYIFKIKKFAMIFTSIIHIKSIAIGKVWPGIYKRLQLNFAISKVDASFNTYAVIFKSLS